MNFLSIFTQKTALNSIKQPPLPPSFFLLYILGAGMRGALMKFGVKHQIFKKTNFFPLMPAPPGGLPLLQSPPNNRSKRHSGAG